jgi:glycosyltransferase involved in cell wall biosynthesis
MEIAGGEILAFLDADDLWPEGKLAAQLDRFERDPELDVVLGRIRHVALDGVDLPDIEFEDLDAKTTSNVNLGSGLFRRRAFERIGIFDEHLHFSEDVDWFLRAREARLRIVIIPEVTLVYRLHGANMTYELTVRDSRMLSVLKRSLERRRAAGIDGDLSGWRSLDERGPGSPSVSVVIPAFDAARYVREAIRSVLAQTHAPLEVIVVDDGSSDTTASVATRFASPVRVVRRAHGGIGAARNTGIAEARGEFIALLDADDLWEHDKLARQLEVFAGDPSLDIVFGGIVQFVSPEFDGVITPGPHEPSRTGRVASTLLMRAEVAARVGEQREDLVVGEFVDWYDRARAAGCRMGQVDGFVARRRIHDANQGVRHRADRTEWTRVVKSMLDRRRAESGGT